MFARVFVVAFAVGQSGSALSASDVQRVVRQNGQALKDACWGTDAGATADVTADVRVDVRMQITASGKVQSASASGNDAGVSRCIESQIKTWTFPASTGSTTVSIPFHFVRPP